MYFSRSGAIFFRSFLLFILSLEHPYPVFDGGIVAVIPYFFRIFWIVFSSLVLQFVISMVWSMLVDSNVLSLYLYFRFLIFM